MGLLSAIFGAKPPYGTPPFAPPHPNTGGAEVPRTPETMDRPHGLSGFIDRLVYPTSALGQLGQALVAGSGGPLSGAMAYLLQQGAERRKGHRKVQQVGDQIGILDEETGQFTPTYSAPQKAHEPHYWESNDGSLHAIGDDGQPKEVYHDPSPKMNFIPDGMGGGQWVAVPQLPSGPPTKPVGNITPIDDPAPANTPPAGGTGESGGYGTFKKAVIGQESGGRYGVLNTQGSGAAGIGQVMPETARVLAGRLGLPYRPELLIGTDPSAQAYQNSITDAATKEAWDASGGDPLTAAKYYFGGSNRSKWGPKTRRYGNSIIMRMGG